MMAGGFTFIAARFGDLLGTSLYEPFGGFTVCLIAITVVYTLILPILLLIPKSLVATADRQVPEVRISCADGISDQHLCCSSNSDCQCNRLAQRSSVWAVGGDSSKVGEIQAAPERLNGS